MKLSQLTSRRRKRLARFLKSTTVTTAAIATGKNIKVYDRHFLQNLVDHSIYPEAFVFSSDRATRLTEPDN